MNANDYECECENGAKEHVGFINNNWLLVCVRTACTRLINTDFFCTYILNFIRRTKYRTFSVHS